MVHSRRVEKSRPICCMQEKYGKCWETGKVCYQCDKGRSVFTWGCHRREGEAKVQLSRMIQNACRLSPSIDPAYNNAAATNSFFSCIPLLHLHFLINILFFRHTAPRPSTLSSSCTSFHYPLVSKLVRTHSQNGLVLMVDSALRLFRVRGLCSRILCNSRTCSLNRSLVSVSYCLSFPLLASILPLSTTNMRSEKILR